MKKSLFLALALVLIPVATLFAGCTMSGGGTAKTLGAGVYSGIPQNATANATNNGITTPTGFGGGPTLKFTIANDGTMTWGQNNTVLVKDTEEYKLVLSNSNMITLQYKQTQYGQGGTVTGYAWQDWNSSTGATTTHNGVTTKTSISGSFDPSSGKVTLTFRWEQNSAWTQIACTYTKE